MADFTGKTVEEILRSKRAAIRNAPLPRGSPSWDEILDLSWEEVAEKKKRGDTGFKTFHKLLKDKRFDK